MFWELSTDPREFLWESSAFAVGALQKQMRIQMEPCRIQNQQVQCMVCFHAKFQDHQKTWCLNKLTLRPTMIQHGNLVKKLS